MLWEKETCPEEDEEDVIGLKSTDARMARWICNVTYGARIFAEELRTWLKFNGIYKRIYRIEDCNGLEMVLEIECRIQQKYKTTLFL